MLDPEKLGIGTVQFGLRYGVANEGGKTGEAEARRIVELAVAAGCRTVDTAAAYGDSEDVLGRILPGEVPFHIVTKTAPLGGKPIDDAAESEFRAAVERSLHRLGRTSVYGLLAHHPADLLVDGGHRLYRVLSEMRERGVAQRIGASVYDRQQIDALLQRFDLDLVQLPLSVLDQRLLRDGTLDRLKDRGIEIHVRSVFLQGLLLMAPHQWPAYFAPLGERLATWRDRLTASRRSAAGAAFAFAAGLPQVDCVIVGFDRADQLAELLADPSGPLPFIADDLACDDPAFVNPGLWKL